MTKNGSVQLGFDFVTLWNIATFRRGYRQYAFTAVVFWWHIGAFLTPIIAAILSPLISALGPSSLILVLPIIIIFNAWAFAWDDIYSKFILHGCATCSNWLYGPPIVGWFPEFSLRLTGPGLALVAFFDISLIFLLNYLVVTATKHFRAEAS